MTIKISNGLKIYLIVFVKLSEISILTKTRLRLQPRPLLRAGALVAIERL